MQKTSRSRLEANEHDNLSDLARKNYPRFVARPPAQAFCVPIQGRYHDTLFPELAMPDQSDLFAAAGISTGEARTPGNTIQRWPPQSITHLSEERFEKLRTRMNFGFAV
jgi:hypothetical protein